ncbi:MAG: hypothetical protein JXR36_01240 [Bacteroidales bacterium]|nr:hypothetical protein [Bacteroidales bacterium]
MKKKTLIIIGILVAVIVLVIIILVNRNSDNEDQSNENQNDNSNSSSGAANNLTASIPEQGYPIEKGVSKRKEVYDMQVKLVNDYGAYVGTSGPDGVWGAFTENAVIKHLKKNKFNTYGELLAAYGANPPSSNSTSGNATNIINIVSSFFSR